MIHPSNFEEKTGFDRIRELISRNCHGPMGEADVGKMSFSNDREEIIPVMKLIDEYMRILREGRDVPLDHYADLTQEMERLQTPGNHIDIEDLIELRKLTGMIFGCVHFLDNKRSEFPALAALTDMVDLDPGLTSVINGIIDEQGNVRDSASAALAKIRKDLAGRRKSVENKIRQHLKAAKKEGWVDRDSEITIRAGRMVIPVPAAHKRKISGFIHDESATGQTVYLEPSEVFETSNEIRDLENAERREIIRILTRFTSEHILPFVREFLESFRFLGKLDGIAARAGFSMKFGAVMPEMAATPVIRWKQAVHPLLQLSLQKQDKEVVPLDITLDSKQRILVISGPNAGGKSVCLKTIGLLQYMCQCGLPVPVKEGSVFGVFEKIFIDIGDEQSLENDLSTYSSHLLNVRFLLKNANERSLFLIDEFGSGTEPQLGGAIAEAVLEELDHRNAMGAVTTHYSNLKLLEGEGRGIVNGAMMFDTRKMQPLFVLKTGRPGSSFAFEIARKIGFPGQILKSAADKTGRKQLDFDEQLHKLESEKKELDKRKKEFRVADDFLAEMIDKYEKLVRDLETRKEGIIDNAHREALSIIESSNKLIENTIREIRESQAEKQKTKKLREDLNKKAEKIRKDAEIDQKAVKKEKRGDRKARENAASEKITVGDWVKMQDQDVAGRVFMKKGNDLWIEFGSAHLKTTVDKCEKTVPPKESLVTASSGLKTGDDLHASLASFGLKIDVRGKRGEEATEEVKRYIDEAIVLKIREVRIIHGKGDGILRSMIHDYLDSHPAIARFRDEHIERGGHGVTIVELK